MSESLSSSKFIETNLSEEATISEENKNEHKVKSIEQFEDPNLLYKQLVNNIKEYHPSSNLLLIDKAYQMAEKLHLNQCRKSGEPYIIHPLCVAIILSELKMDKETIVVGLLHDIVEDTIMTDSGIKREFGEEIAFLIDGVTKLDKTTGVFDKTEKQSENIKKILGAMSKDIRVIIVKLADRLHNMRTLEFMPRRKQIEIARETIDIYAPIAQRLGIAKIKNELEDLAMKYLNPQKYFELKEELAINEKERVVFADKIIEEVTEELMKKNIMATVEFKMKHCFSIYKKMVNQNKTLEQLYDVFSIQIICCSIRDCYTALGVMHKLYKPVLGRFKDYIAMPKENMYQAIHIVLINSEGKFFEVHIKDKDMVKTAEYGITAHWKYKEGTDKDGKENERYSKKIEWLQQILEWQKDISDNKSFLAELKNDLNLFTEDIYCFTPKGDVKCLKKGATPIDFAYSIHNEIGNSMVGALINGKEVGFDYILKNGDRVEIITDKNSEGPSWEWLDIARTTQARNGINKKLGKQDINGYFRKGEIVFKKFCDENHIKTDLFENENIRNKILKRMGYANWKSFIIMIGRENIIREKNVKQILKCIKKINDTIELKEWENSVISKKININLIDEKLHVEDKPKLLVRLAKCCNPIIGDNIVACITKEGVLMLHRKECLEYKRIVNKGDVRPLQVNWENTTDEVSLRQFLIKLKIVAQDEKGVLMHLTNTFAQLDIDIKNLDISTSNGKAEVKAGVSVENKKTLNHLIEQIKKIDRVLSVERIIND